MSLPVEDRLIFDDSPSPPPVAPVVVPVTPPQPLQPVTPKAPVDRRWIAEIVMWGTLTAGLASYIVWDNWRGRIPGPTPTPAVDAVTLGKTFAPKLAASLADGFETAATMIAAGTSVTEADKALQTKFATARNEAFKTMVAPEFAKVLPEGQEPKDAATREAFARIHRDFASGLRGAR